MDAYKILDLPVTASRAQIREAYRALARRWHPDRFAEGPERDWAGERMAQINAAYRMCMKGPAAAFSARDDRAMLTEIAQMIDQGQYAAARQRLMTVSTRCAEWNYLFGAVLMKLRDTQKALIYLRIAAHQQPENAKYARALQDACTNGSLRDRVLSAFHRKAR